MQVIDTPISEIKPYKDNPRHNDNAVAAVAASIREFGFKVPCVVDKHGTLVAGHTRVKAARQLGMDTVPCIVVDDLTDEQIRAFRLADNKVAEIATWDFPLLEMELSEIDDIDMSDFGFVSTNEGLCGVDDYKQTKNLDNFFKANFEQTNDWGIPETGAFTGCLDGIEWVSFGEKASIKNPANTGIHFYIDDYKFDSIWKQPDKWLELFKKCRAVVSPDFSNYTDMPKAQQLWNHYRRQWCAKYWQDNGINVVSSLSWANGQIYDWSFAGIPEGTTVATSFVGDGIDKEQSIDELQSVIELLNPKKMFIKASAKDEKILRERFKFEVISNYLFRG